MWDDDQDGTPEDYEEQQALVEELEARCQRLLKRCANVSPVDYGSGTLHRCRIGDVDIKREQVRGLWIDVFVYGDGDRRAYTSGGYINRRLVRELVLPALRSAMILDDIIDAGDADDAATDRSS